MSSVFVTATGTGIGKTFVTAGLIRALRAQGRNARALKPVISGFDPADAGSDTARLLAAMGEAATPEAVARISPWRFSAPLSPDMAAAREDRSIDFDSLVAFCRGALAATSEPVLVEGVGGIMVPLDDEHAVRDWIEALGIPALLVAGSYLGALSHTLTAVEAGRNLSIAAIIVSESENSTVALDETCESLQSRTAIPVIALPRGASTDPIIARIASLLF